MTSSRLSTLTLTLAVATGLATLASCAGQGDVDRTQPDKVTKSIFFDASGQPKAFYYRQTFVNSENTTDRPWDEREYMRVDWSIDLAVPEPEGSPWDPMTGFFLGSVIVHDQSYVQETTMSDPNFKDRPIMTDDYIEFLQNK